MSYTKQTWQTGDTITAEKLNHIEDGVDDLSRQISDVEESITQVIESYTTLTPYLEKSDAYITTDGTYVSISGYNTYHIHLNPLDICRFSWATDFWGQLSVGSIITVKANNTYERVAGYKKYGAFYTTGKESIVCAIEGVTDVYIVAPTTNDITVSINEPFFRLSNDVISSKILDAKNTIRTQYYIASASFNYFNSPYGSYFIKMSAGDKLIINKSLTAVTGVGFIAVADGTSTNITAKEYTAETDCIFCAFDNTTVSGDFTYIPSNSIKIASKDIINDGDVGSFDGVNGVAFGTSLTALAATSNGFLTRLSALSGITFDNQGIGSSVIFGDGGNLDMLARIKSYSSYSDKRICLLEGFVNDWYANRNLGTWEDSAETTVCGCVRSALNYILSQNANLTIFLILDHYGKEYSTINCKSTAKNAGDKTQYEYYEEIAKVAESLGIPVIKEYELSQINENTPQYLADNIHLNALGARQSGNVIWSKMKQFPVNAVS